MARWSPRRHKADAGAAAAEPSLAERLRDSGLVDDAWYRDTYADFRASGLDAAAHYAATGADLGHDPNPVFSTRHYLDANPDVRAAGMNPLLHYLVTGCAEGRSIGPGFDTAYYLAQNPEIAAADIDPLVHYLRFGRHEGRIAVPYDEAEAFEVGVRAKRQALTGPAAALFRGPRADHVHFPLLTPDPPGPGGGLPLPPLRLAQRIGSVTLEDFDASGRAIRDAIVRALPGDFRWDGIRCLDFGSGVGRAIRHFAPEAQRAEFWGCDIDGPSIRWSVQNLSPPFRFFQIGEEPTIPLESDSFDLVYAVSVLSHIHSTWHQWLMEIRRILKPGGTVFVTFLGPTPMMDMLGEPYWTRGADFGMYVKGPHQNWNDGGPMIFVSPEWLKAFWGSLFDIDYIAIDGLMNYQSFCVMRKPAMGAPIRTEIPVLKLGTEQPFDADAFGSILPQFDAGRPFRDSYGLDLPTAGPHRIEGWIVFRGDAPASLTVDVDGQPVAATVAFDPGQPYRDWDVPQTAFSADVDLSAVALGAHRLTATVRNRAGRSHPLSIPLTLR
ncbi:class I SAM-dependent methyltransferase [Lichenibacterium ramalinae]|nr:class I SAM-dependent methyltransferase [Lichenibacterium ramalinae]